jgi:hypothetical protein
MKFNKFNLVLIVIIALLIGVIVFDHMPISGEDKYSKQKQEIDSLSKLIIGLEKDQLKYDSLITNYKDSLVTMDHQIDSTKTQIKQIQQQYGKKIKALNLRLIITTFISIKSYKFLICKIFIF